MLLTGIAARNPNSGPSHPGEYSDGAEATEEEDEAGDYLAPPGMASKRSSRQYDRCAA